MDQTIFSELQAQRGTLRHVGMEQQNKKKSSAGAPTRSQDEPADNTNNEETKRWKSFFQSGCSNWYKALEAITLSSTFCLLTREEAEVIVRNYEQAQDKCPLTDDAESLANTKARLHQLTVRLATTIDIETAKSSVNKAFIKLDTRSPKDSPKALAKAEEAYKQRLVSGVETDLSPNERWKILSEEAIKSLAISTADEALDILLDSERVYEDLKFALETPAGISSALHPQEEEPTEATEATDSGLFKVEELTPSWPVCIVARAWDPRLKPASEFRGICSNGRLTCLNQYYHSLYFPEIQENRKMIQQDIQKCFHRQDVQAAVAQLGGHCILDFCWLEPGNVLVVESNPFDGKHFGTLHGSTGLFLWDNPKDQEVMMGKSDFEFRIREEPEEIQKLKHQTHPAWRDIIFPTKFKKVDTSPSY